MSNLLEKSEISQPYRICLYGGAFNPITTTHIEIIKLLWNSGQFDELYVVPSFIHPDGIPMEYFFRRVGWIELALSDEDLPIDKVRVSTIEKTGGGTTGFTSEMIKNFRSRAGLVDYLDPKTKITFAMGADNAKVLAEGGWEGSEELLELCDIAVIGRDGHSSFDFTKYSWCSLGFDHGFKGSLTDVRTALAVNNPNAVRHLIPEKIYISVSRVFNKFHSVRTNLDQALRHLRTARRVADENELRVDQNKLGPLIQYANLDLLLQKLEAMIEE